MEIRKLSSWSRARPAVHHFRTHQGREVDLVLEGPGGRIVGIEVKMARSAGAQDLRHLQALAELVPDRFHRGIILYGGDQLVPFSPRMHAVPHAALWRGF